MLGLTAAARGHLVVAVQGVAVRASARIHDRRTPAVSHLSTLSGRLASEHGPSGLLLAVRAGKTPPTGCHRAASENPNGPADLLRRYMLTRWRFLPTPLNLKSYFSPQWIGVPGRGVAPKRARANEIERVGPQHCIKTLDSRCRWLFSQFAPQANG